MPWIRDHATGLQIFAAKDVPPRFRCTVVVKSEDGQNTICGTPFHDEGQFIRHASNCAKKHQDEIQKAAPSNRLPAWLTQGPATDYEDWLNEVDAAGESNRSKVIQGRKKF